MIMNRLALLAAVGVILSASSGITDEAASKRLTVQIELDGHTFTLPPGFEIELVAGPPLVDRPITAAFDDEGRLYVADSSGSNDKIDKQLAEKPHRIVRLEDTDGDGRFDKSVVFADMMMFPEGTMWFDGSLYVAAPPSIWKLTDTDGDGVADKREDWFPGKTLTGCANDLHGPYLGPDGWIYWAKGAFARQTYERVGKSLRVIPDLPLNILGKEVPVTSEQKSSDSQPSTLDPQRTWSTRASHIFRCRPDGSGLEVVMTGGMDNPVDVVFTPGGERIISNTFIVHPGGGLRDGLLHAVYGGIYGKDHDPIREPQHKWTGPDLMPVLAHLGGAAAPCGLEIYRSRVFGADYESNLFTCCFNMHKITRHVLEPAGATFKSNDSDFLVSSNLDFHPTDILEDADGSLVVVDTGGWYKLCCPTSQLHKPDILGAIYRVRRKDSVANIPNTSTDWKDPRGLKIAWSKQAPAELTRRLLGDARPAVRERAIRELAQRGEASIAALAEAVRVPPQAEIRRNAVWALTRLDHTDARAAVRTAIADRDETVRQAAIHSVSLHRDEEAVPQLNRIVETGSPQNRRAAAEALGRIGHHSAVPTLLRSTAQASATTDRMLQHSLIYALIEIADPHATAPGLDDQNPWTRRAALIAIDQVDGGKLDPNPIAAMLESSDGVIREAAAWIVSRHAEWGDALAAYLRKRLTAPDLNESERSELRRQLAQFARNASIQELLATTVQNGSPSTPTRSAGAGHARQIALEAMRDSGLKEMPKLWLTTLTATLARDDVDSIQSSVAAARAVPIPKDGVAEIAAALVKIDQNNALPAGTRLAALAAVPSGLTSVDAELFEFLQSSLNPDTAVSARSAAADVLSKSKLTAAQLQSLADSFKTASPLEVDRLLAAYEHSTDSAVGEKLVASLKRSPALAALRADSIQRSIAKCGPSVQEQAQELFAAINVNLSKQKERLDELLASLSGDDVKPGDIRRGQAVFMSQKAACASCHQFGYLGGKVGPDMTRIGGVRNERDLLESIAFPSASFVRSYESLVVGTKDGRVLSGIVRKDAPDEIVLAINATEEARIARDEVEEMKPGSVSVMPSGLDQQLTRQELADLIAFLKAAK
jgi:putative membrane-bound dehydrogenase-like protein